MTIKHQAFLDLEAGLAKQLETAWGPYWRELSREIGRAADAGDWDRVHELIETLSLDEVVAKRGGALETFGMAALLLGASRLTTLTNTAQYAEPRTELLSAGVGQAKTMLAENGAEALRRDLHAVMEARQRDLLEADPAQSLVAPVAVGAAGAAALSALSRSMQARTTKRALAYFALTASLHVSRMSNMGFFVEATVRGVQEYQINEVMDSRTCPICKRMHGQTFSVEDGYTHMVQVLDTDPALLSLVDPWPRQTKEAVHQFEALSAEELRARNYHVPPYHPLCRGIVVPKGEVVVIEEEIPGTVRTPAETILRNLNPTLLMDHLFGVQPG